ncbi:MAG: hypothetical protein JXB06_10555 [Spirochaetales bacterium]|nr:hypothetical protein [Spirochaetales bacterium]
MSLFAILGVPCITLFLLFADDRQPAGGTATLRRGLLVLEFIKGFFYAIAGLVVTFLVRRYAFLSYRGFPLYLLFLFTDHLIPALFLVVMYFLLYARQSYRVLLCFGAGFYTLIALVEVVARYGHYEPYHLFLLPAVRMGGLLFITIFFVRYREWYGLLRILFLILLVSVPFLSAAITWLYMRSFLFWSALVTVLFFFGSLVYTYMEWKR